LDEGHQIREPWSGRVVAVTYGGQVWTAAPESIEFREIPSAHAHNIGPFVLPSRRSTIVASTHAPPMVVGQDELHSWPAVDEAKGHDAGGITVVGESTTLGAILLVDAGYLQAIDRRGALHDLAALDKGEFGEFVEAPAIRTFRRIVLQGPKRRFRLSSAKMDEGRGRGKVAGVSG
jgi:hypothetical protein